MTQGPERRRKRRAVATGRLTGHASLSVEFRLLDLSPTGIRIETLALLRPGGSCILQVPSPSGSLQLAAQVVWTTIVGQDQTPEGHRVLRYQSGLMFTGLSPEQERGLASLLDRLSPEVG
jgi:hypothetical protein